jgi:hypothetical protein
MSRWNDLLQDLCDPALGRPWYRRPGFWYLLTSVVVPFGWVLPLYRLARVQAVARRTRHV